MTLLWHDTHTADSNVIHTTFPGPDADVRSNREAFDAVVEVPHRFDSPDRMVMSWALGFATAVGMMFAGGWL